MAEIKAVTNEKIFSLTAFKGLHQNPDGDTKLKMGEAADMYNWRVTRDGNLQRRPGTKVMVDLETENPIKGLWVGFVKNPDDETEGVEVMLGACNSAAFIFWADVDGKDVDDVPWRTFSPRQILLDENDDPLPVNTDGDVFIFGFNGIAYILDGAHYYYFNGFSDWGGVVDGYVPLVWTAIPPINSQSEDNSASLENVNRLTLKRRIWISPDGTLAAFQLPEKPIKSVNYVMDLSDGSTVSADDYTVNTTNGTVTFDSAPAQGVNSYEIEYELDQDDFENLRYQVERMHYAELYAGQQDTRIFLYGDRTNRTIYSGIDYNGNPRADYYPDLYECDVGDENTPITGMIRHYSQLVCFKSNSTWNISATTSMMADGLNIPAFYVIPVNRTIGNAAMGQVRQVLNSPFTLFGNDLYEWKNSSYYTSNLTSDERQAKRISDRIWKALEGYDIKNCYCYDDNDNQEYYICHNGEALVLNYAVDAWSRYTQFDVSCMVNCQGEVYIGSNDGKLKHLDYRWLNDDNGDGTVTAIPAYWESGSMAFGQDYMRKYAAMIWVSVKPEPASEVWVTVNTDKKSNFTEKVTETFMATLAQANFGRWSFRTNRKPQMKRLKVKAKKFVFYKLIFHTETDDTRATVLAADIRVRFTGYAK